MRVAGLTLLLFTTTACGARVVGGGGESASSDTSDSNSGSNSNSNSSSSSNSETSVDPDPSAEGDGDGDTSEGDFVPPADWGLQGDECTVYEQDCDEGEKCVTTLDPAFNVFRCVPVLGDKGVGEACIFDGASGSDDCDANSHCWNLVTDEQGVEHGECVPFCTGSVENPTCPGQGESCGGYECRVIGQIGYPFCVERCDPLAQDCREGMACFFDGGYLSYFCGVINVPGALGEPCDWTQECGAGLICMPADMLPACPDFGCCTAFCATGDDAGCDASWPGTTCSEPLDPALMPGCPTYGACLIPGA